MRLLVISCLLVCTSAQNTLYLTGDQSIELFVNGQQKQLTNGGDYSTIDQVSLDRSVDRVVAVHGVGNSWCSGMIISTDDDSFYTDYRFRCTGQYYPGWMNIGYEDYGWSTSYIVGSNDGTNSPVCPSWTQIPEMSSQAKWLWTANVSNAEEDLDDEVYCRGYLPVCESNPCQNGANCNPNAVGSICECRDGYTGQFCETHLNLTCGNVLNEPEPGMIPELPEGWNQYCYILANRSNYESHSCTQLLEGLPIYGSGNGLLAAGGNFGCMVYKEIPGKYDWACVDDYQHNMAVGACYNCVYMGVCLRYPTTIR